MNTRRALSRLVSLRVPGAIEATDALPRDPNAVLDLAAVAKPLLIAAQHTGSSPVIDEAARLTDLNVATATQKRFAVQAMFSLGGASWDKHGQLNNKRFSKEAKRLFEKTFVGFVFHKHRRVLHTSAVLLSVTLVCVMGSWLLETLLAVVAYLMGIDMASAHQYLSACKKHGKSYGPLEKTLGAARTHGGKTFPDVASLTEGQVQALAQESRQYFENFDETSIHALTDHVKDKALAWSVQNDHSFGTRRVADLLGLKVSVLDPTMSRVAPIMMICTAIALVVAVVKQVDLLFFEENPQGRQRTGRVLNAMAFVLGGSVLVWSAQYGSGWSEVLTLILCLFVVKQSFTVRQKTPF